MLVAVEGLDQSGKATQAQDLRDRLRATGYKSRVVSFPDYGTFLGEEIARSLQGERDYGPETMQLLYVANRFERKADIDRWHAAGLIVLFDRYIASGVAYGEAPGSRSGLVDDPAGLAAAAGADDSARHLAGNGRPLARRSPVTDTKATLRCSRVFERAICARPSSRTGCGSMPSRHRTLLRPRWRLRSSRDCQSCADGANVSCSGASQHGRARFHRRSRRDHVAPRSPRTGGGWRPRSSVRGSCPPARTHPRARPSG